MKHWSLDFFLRITGQENKTQSYLGTRRLVKIRLEVYPPCREEIPRPLLRHCWYREARCPQRSVCTLLNLDGQEMGFLTWRQENYAP